ncbi:MAG: phosphoglucosamine mutase [Actinomycetota bacterium]|nr:phosphoglucosamine mutase [Actinomycetota bacterium]
MGRLFGTDGVRGVAGRDLTADVARSLGMAAVAVLGRHGVERPVFVVGRDTRASGETLERALVEGIQAGGGDVLVAGVQTTPAVAFLTVDLGAAAGAVLSASHNPPEYNGIKFFGQRGYKLPDELEDEIEVALAEGLPRQGVSAGDVRELPEAAERYLAHLVTAAGGRLDGMRVVVDCANGAAFAVAPEALRRLGAEVHPLFDRPDGHNINVGCGAMHPEVVAEAVARLGADAGVAHDGDADRALFADAHGSIVDGDQVLAACAFALRDAGRLAGNAVVTTVMANLGFHRSMEDAGIEVLSTKVGDRYVLEEMLRSGAAVGGEQSGHVIFRDHATTGDGVLTAIKFLSLAAARGASLQEVAACMRRYPQVLENVEVADRDGLEDATDVWTAVKEAERDLGDRGRVLVRASGTEPLVRVMVEAESEEEAAAHARAIADRVRLALG